MAKMIVTNPGGIRREYEVKPCRREETPGPYIKMTARRGQTILGFGMTLTDSSCILINRLSEDKRAELLHEIFSPDEMGCGMGRICVGASDYADSVYHYAPVSDDREMKYFDASHDERDILPVLRAALRENPDLFLFSSPWSPPGWMKTSGIMQGGWMRREYLDAYVAYYLAFIRYYEERGVRIRALTPQNETETDQVGRMPACLWHPDIEAEFVKRMRRALDANGYEDIRIWLTDHNLNLWRRPYGQLKDKEVEAAVDGIAWHPYEGYPQAAQWVGEKHPKLSHHWTEGDVLCDLYGGINAPHAAMRYCDYAKCFLLALDGGFSSITLWNLALDEEGYPNVGPFGCRGAVEISRDGARIRRNKDYEVLGHFSRYVKRNARRIILDQSAAPGNLTAAGFENPDGSIVLMIANTASSDSPLVFGFEDAWYQAWIRRESVTAVLL